jgi:integrase
MEPARTAGFSFGYGPAEDRHANGKEQSAVTNWQHDLRELFKDAGITSEGNMLSHRLRDTFALDLLEKGVALEEVSKLLSGMSPSRPRKNTIQSG